MHSLAELCFGPVKHRRAAALACAVVTGSAACSAQDIQRISLGLSPAVTIDEDVYTFAPANNGAFPLWNYGSTNITRLGDKVFVSGLETMVDFPPLNNTRCTMWRRDVSGWTLVMRDPSGWTREPCPLVSFPKQQRVFLSTNPTLNPPGRAGGGPSRPSVLEFTALQPNARPSSIEPTWLPALTPPQFAEHSYRSFAADGQHGELILIQNIGYTHAEWTFRGRNKRWTAQGQLHWPRDNDRGNQQPIRLCYLNVAVVNRAVHLVGVSDIVEPVDQWKQKKRELNPRQSQFVFRRLFYSWTPDIERDPFSAWVEISNREETAGNIRPGDLWVDPDGGAHIVWAETALDTQLRDAFFPGKKQRHELNYAVVRKGRVASRVTLVAKDEDQVGPIPHLPRLHVTPEKRLFILYYVDGTDHERKPVSENRIVEIGSNGSITSMARVPLSLPLNNYMTAGVRGGSIPARFIDVLGISPNASNTVRYARIDLY